MYIVVVVVCQAEDSIRDAQESRGLGDVYKRQNVDCTSAATMFDNVAANTVDLPTSLTFLSLIHI